MDATRLALSRMKSELRAKRVSDIPQPKAVQITVQVGGEEPGEEAVAFLGDRLRTRLRRPGILADLNTANVALIEVLSSVVADYMDADGRMVSQSVTDIRFATSVNDIDDTDTGDWVAEAAGTGEIGDYEPGFDTANEG